MPRPAKRIGTAQRTRRGR